MIGSAEFRKKKIAHKDLLAGTRLGEASYAHRGKMWPSSAGFEVFDKSPQMTHELDGLESVAGPTSVGIGVESIGPDTLRSKGFGLHILPDLFRLFGQGIPL